jgi:hypothetical protein
MLIGDVNREQVASSHWGHLFTAVHHGMKGVILNDEHLIYFEEFRSVFYVLTVATMQCVYEVAFKRYQGISESSLMP